ncbi:hypothetical protein [Bremerella cremea]|nr:hypothetical protein [Bremerella cremea]
MDADEPVTDHDNPDLHVSGEGTFVDPQLLYLDIKPEKVVLMPRKMSKFTIVGLSLLVTPFFAVFGTLAFLLGRSPWVDAGLVAAVWLVTCSLGTVIGWYTYRGSLEGPWLVIDRVNQVFHFPRRGETIPFSKIDHLLDIGTYPFHQSIWSSDTCGSELLLVLKENDTLQRVPFLRSSNETTNDFRHLANALADLKLVPVKRIRGFSYSPQIQQRWLTSDLQGGALPQAAANAS